MSRGTKSAAACDWVRDLLVCPRDHERLTFYPDRCECPLRHSYAIAGGVPVLLISEATPTHGAIARSLEAAASRARAFSTPDSTDTVDPFVQAKVAATCGNLYKPLTGRVTRYPIPNIPLPGGDGRLLLDLGCNWGRWTIAAARNGYRAVGIDPDLEAILAAGRIARRLHVSASFIVADARFLPFPPGAFDLVFSYSVFQHFSQADAEASLDEIKRVLKVRGSSVIQMANMWGVRSFYHQGRRGFTDARDFEVRYWSPKRLRATFSKHVGPTSLSVDGYFGLGIQETDIDLLRRRYRPVVQISGLLKACANRFPWMARWADSLYVRSTVLSDGHDKN